MFLNLPFHHRPAGLSLNPACSWGCFNQGCTRRSVTKTSLSLSVCCACALPLSRGTLSGNAPTFASESIRSWIVWTFMFLWNCVKFCRRRGMGRPRERAQPVSVVLLSSAGCRASAAAPLAGSHQVTSHLLTDKQTCFRLSTSFSRSAVIRTLPVSSLCLEFL